MTSPMPYGSIDRITGTMIELARCSAEHRIILAGSNEPDRIFELRSCGFSRVVTTATCKPCRSQYDIAFVEWRQHSIKALETTLDWFVYFLSPAGVLVIWIDTASGQRKLRSAIERLGFHVETGTRCENGFIISARRNNVVQQTMAAVVRQRMPPCEAGVGG
jgi:hypothetical protein